MQINILIPYKEMFDKEKTSSVSITVRNNLKYTEFKNHIKIYGKVVENPISKKHFVPIKNPINPFKSKNKNLADLMCRYILSSKDKNQIVEIHNRPYLQNYILEKIPYAKIFLFFHNNPQDMKGSKSINERLKLLKNATLIVCVSNFIKEKFLDGLDFNSKKIIVLYNGVTRHIKKFPKKSKEVIFVGRIVKEKGVHLFVNTVERIANKFPEWKFTIIGSVLLGSNEKLSSFSKMIISKFEDISNQTYTTGFIDQKKVQRKMKTSSIIVIPSIWEEPFGLVAAEAMANGMAVIASSIGGIPEIINRNGILIKDIDEKKLQYFLTELMKDEKKLFDYQKKSWDNFNKDSKSSSKKLDSLRKRVLNYL